VNKSQELIRKFYESFGWNKVEGGVYGATAIFYDYRKVMLEYRYRARRRDGKVFQSGGRYFLDAGCGARPAQDYSKYHQYHVCIDLTFAGLRESREKIGENGLYVLGDTARLPFRDGVFDGVLCSHTLYLMSRDEQHKAVNELCRVLKSHSCCVIVYLTQGFQRKLLSARAGIVTLMKTFLPGIVINVLKRIGGFHDNKEALLPRQIYVFPPGWFKQQLEPSAFVVDVRCHRVMEKPFSNLLIPNNKIGSILLAVLSALEERFPHGLVRWSRFITVTIEKGRGDLMNISAVQLHPF